MATSVCRHRVAFTAAGEQRCSTAIQVNLAAQLFKMYIFFIFDMNFFFFRKPSLSILVFI